MLKRINGLFPEDIKKMEKGGFIARKIVIRKTDYSSGTKDDVIRFLEVVRDAILSAGIWHLDTSFHSGSSSPVEMDSTNYKWTHGLFFENGNGSKLCISYTYSGSSYGGNRKDVNYNGNYDYFGGLCMTMIPPGEGTFDLSKVNVVGGFAPYRSTPTVGLCVWEGNATFSSSAGAQYTSSTARCSTLNYMRLKGDGRAWFTFVMKGDFIAVLHGSSYEYSERCKIIAIGDMVKCMMPDDNDNGAGWGCFLSGTYEGYECRIAYGEDNCCNISGNVTHSFNRTVNTRRHGVIIRKKDAYPDNLDEFTQGMWLAIYWTVMTSGARAMTYENDNGGAVDGKYQCSPIVIYQENNAANVNPYPGKRTKGSFRKDTFISISNSSMPRGTTFDNGNYIYIGANLLMGWDRSNTLSGIDPFVE